MLPGNCLGLVIADVCDKGVGSALFMALFRSLIRVFSRRIHAGMVPDEKKRTPANIDLNRALQAVSLTNDYIAEEHDRDGMFATVFFGVLSPETGDLAYINAGHDPLYMIGPRGIKQNLKPTSPAVGTMPGLQFGILRSRLDPGDTLIGYTDGVTEALSPQNTIFSKERLLSLIDRPALTASESIEEIKFHLFNHIDNAPQFDDITMIAVHRKS
jgi:sigma-B regulation protein RsbU (phosphoserine phosphatase)